MSRFVQCLVCALAVVATAGIAQGAIVDLLLTTSPSEWTLEASSSDGDNAGISGFNIDLVGLGAGGTAIANAPKGFTMDGFINRGFTVGNGDSAGDTVTLFAGQVGGGPALDDPATILFGVGQVPGTIPGLVDGSGLGVPWSAPVLLAHGTMDPGAWETMGFGESTNANVFTVDGEVGAEAAEVTLSIIRIPEPASFAILGIAVLGLIGLRRRIG